MTPEDKNYPIGVYLNEEEKQFYDQLANELKVSRHSLLQLAMKRFIDRYKAGKEKIEVIIEEKGRIKKDS